MLSTSKKKVLICYATHSGSSFEIAEFVGEILSKNFAVTIQKAFLSKADDLLKYDFVVMGSGSWKVDGHEGYPQPALYDLLAKAKEVNLKNKPFAFFGCGDNSYTQFCGVVDYLENFVKAVEGVKVADSLRVDSFFFDLKKNVRLVETWAESLNKALMRLK